MSVQCDDLDLLRGLVDHYSPSRQEEDAVSFLVESMEQRGINSYIDGAGNAVGEVGDGFPHIALVGHIDTVKGIIPVRENSGCLYGRGTVDAKGPLATFVAAVSRFTKLDQGRITVVGAVEEECPTSRGARYLVDQMKPDHVFIGEPSGWDSITIGYKGIVGFNFKLKQSNAHFAGNNLRSGDKAITFYNNLLSYLNQHEIKSEFGSPRLELRRINTIDEGLSENVEAYFSVRIPPGYGVENLINFIEVQSGDAEIECDQKLEGIIAKKNTPLVRALLQGIRQEGGQPTFKKKTGTSDMCVIGPEWKCPIVAYGPGDSSLDHTPDEHIILDDYLRSIQVMTNALKSLIL
tara:strand:- start:196316 stop:197362 length:1047 start_codon:yes stop_codon:yes gene_type:complete